MTYSSIFSNAARTAAMTKAENVQSFPWMAVSTCSITSLGKRMVLFVVGGIDGILKLPIIITSQYICIAFSVGYGYAKVCIANAMHLCYHAIEVMKPAEFCPECWNKINGTNDPPEKFIISEESDLCEGCGEYKPVVIKVKEYDDYDALVTWLLWPWLLLEWLICLPYKIYRYYKKKKS